MGKRLCVGALVLSIVVSLAAIPVAAFKVVEGVRALVAFDFQAERRAVPIDPR